MLDPSETLVDVRLAPGDTLPQRVRAACMRRLSLGNGSELVHSPLTGINSVLPEYVGSILANCRDFRPLDEHIRTTCTHLGISLQPHGRIETILKDLHAKGYLLSESSFRSIGPHDTTVQESKISAIGILTAGRPGLLERCLTGFIS